MQFRHAKLAGATACAGALILSAPVPAQAIVATDARAAIDPIVEMAERAHTRALRRNVRLYRSNARLRGIRPERHRDKELLDWSIAHLRERNGELRRRNVVLRRQARERRAAGLVAAPARASAGAGGSTATPAHLQAIAACESGGDPSAVGGGGAYRGKYQFSPSTWASVGGSGDPAAAPEAEQDRRAAMLYAQQGSSPWPVCGG